MIRGWGRYLCAVALLAFILSAGLFLSACGGGGGSTGPGGQNPGNQNPGGQNPGNQNPGNQNPGDQSPPAVTVSLSAPTSTISEGQIAFVDVRLSADPKRNVTIPLVVDTTSSTSSVEDYSGLQGVTFASGETTQSITLTAVDDTEDEENETVVLGFGTLPEGVSAGTPSSFTITIEDNDHTAVTVSLSVPTSTISEGQIAFLNVRLSEDPRRNVTIPITVDTTSSTAQPEDYSLPESVTVASGITSKIFLLTAVDDTADEENETVVLGFGTLPEGVSEGTPSSFTVTIEDNDEPLPPDSCDDERVLDITGNYDAKTADPDPDPLGEGLFICGDSASNVIQGDGGDDTIWGEGGNDTLQGREGDDTLHGGPGEDTVVYWVVDEDNATPLDENLDISLFDEEAASDGRGGTDTLTGIENVKCEGQQGNNTSVYVKIVGNSGNNRIDCTGSRKSILIGREGNDTFIRNPVGEDYYDGSSGADTLDYSGLDLTNIGTLKIALNLIEGGKHKDFEDNGPYGKIGTNVGGSSGVTFEGYARLAGENSDKGHGQANIENIIGTNFNDELTGHAGNNRIEGRRGADTLRGEGGNDELIGGGGADTLYGGPGEDTFRAAGGGADTLYGGTENDTYYADFYPLLRDTVVENQGEGRYDTLYYNTDQSNNVNHAAGESTPPYVEIVYGTSLPDIIRASTTNDVTIYGGAGNDTLYGGAGNDTFYGGEGSDTFDGGKGSDTYYATSAEEGSITDSGGNFDRLYYTDTSGISHPEHEDNLSNGSSPSGIEFVYGTEHNDIIRSGSWRTTKDPPVRLVGGPGNDRLYGSLGIDKFIGCGGSNHYYHRTGLRNRHSPHDRWGNEFYVTASGSGQDTIINFYQGDGDTLHIMDYGGSHSNLTITKIQNTQVKIAMANSAKTVVVRAASNTDDLLNKFKDSSSGRIKISSSDHAECAKID